MYKKKGITSLIIISLLLVSSVLGVYYLNNWFYLYQDDFEKVNSSKNIDEKFLFRKSMVLLFI